MRIVRNIDDFKQLILHPNPDEIYALVPREFDVLSNKPEQILQDNIDCAVYGDVEIYNGKDTIIKFNPSFDVDIWQRGFSLSSPVFIRTSKPIYCNGTELDHVMLEILRQVVGIHIAEPIFRWKQQFHTDQAKETNTL